MAVCHPRPGITHHLRNFSPYIRPVTVDTAVGTGRFLLSERAEIETPEGICLQLAALRAEIMARAVPVAAVDSHHRFDRPLLTEYSAASVVRHDNAPPTYSTRDMSKKSFSLHKYCEDPFTVSHKTKPTTETVRRHEPDIYSKRKARRTQFFLQLFDSFLID